MKENKNSQLVVLGVLILALVGTGIWYVMTQMKPATPPPPTTNAATPAGTDPAKKPAVEEPKGAVLPWIMREKLPELVKKGQDGRDPMDGRGSDLFGNAIAKVPTTTEKPRVITPRHTTSSSGPLMPTGGMEIDEQRLTVTLDWVSYDELVRAIEEAELRVRVEPGSRPNSVVLTGTNPDFDQAVEIIQKMNMPPPAPDFVLVGIIETKSRRTASIQLDTIVYNLVAGDAVPNTGWTITDISSHSVTLNKGSQSVSLTLAGGNPS